MNDVTRRIRAAVRPGPAALTEDASLLLLLPDPKQLARAMEGFARARLHLFVYAISSPSLALDYLHGRGRRLGALPLVLVLDGDPLTPAARKLLAEVRRDPRLKYLTVVMLHEELEPETDGAGVTLHLARPSDEAGFEKLAMSLVRLLPLAR